MAMVFTLVSEGQEWINARYEKELQEREAEEERLLLEAEEAERVKNNFSSLELNSISMFKGYINFKTIFIG